MVKDRRAIESPLAHLTGLNVKADRRRERRALSIDDVKSLLAAAQNGEDIEGMSGPERAMLYRLAVETGLRRAELASLKRGSFDLDGEQPTVTVAAAYSKNRRADTIPLRTETAEVLKVFLATKMPGVQAFNMPPRRKNVAMFRADLKAAGIPYWDEDDRVADFHALTPHVRLLARCCGRSSKGDAADHAALDDHAHHGQVHPSLQERSGGGHREASRFVDTRRRIGSCNGHRRRKNTPKKLGVKLGVASTKT